MNKKTGILLASLIGVLVLCCGGVFYLTRTTLERVKETIASNRSFVATSLEKTGKSWDEAVFAEFADKEFLTPEGRDGTKKRFAIFNQKLGKLKTLGKVEDVPQSLVTKSGEKDRGFYLSFTVDGEFEKGKGKFKVTVRNDGPKPKIYSIALNSNELMEMTDSGLDQAKERLKKTTEGTKK
ncbi:MAG: hypothetical protein WCK51_00250 [Armatimonadota bacterium]